MSLIVIDKYTAQFWGKSVEPPIFLLFAVLCRLGQEVHARVGRSVPSQYPRLGEVAQPFLRSRLPQLEFRLQYARRDGAVGGDIVLDFCQQFGFGVLPRPGGVSGTFKSRVALHAGEQSGFGAKLDAVYLDLVAPDLVVGSVVGLVEPCAQREVAYAGQMEPRDPRRERGPCSRRGCRARRAALLESAWCGCGCVLPVG